MGQFKPMVKMETTEPSVELKLKKGGKVAKKADGGMMGSPMSAADIPPAMPARGGMPMGRSPMKPSLSMRRRAMKGMPAGAGPAGPVGGAASMQPSMPMPPPAMKKGGKADMGQDKAMIKKAFKQHDMQEHKGGKGTALKLKHGGKMATGGVVNGQGGYAKGGIINTEGQGGEYRNTKMDTAKPDHSPAKTGGVKMGNGGGYATGGVAKSNGGGYKKGGKVKGMMDGGMAGDGMMGGGMMNNGMMNDGMSPAAAYKKGGSTKKAYATGGTVNSGKPVAMPQGAKKPSSPVSTNRVAGTFKKGGKVTPAEGNLMKAFGSENKTAMKQAKAQSNDVYSKYQKMQNGGAASGQGAITDRERKMMDEDMSKGAYDASKKHSMELEDAMNPLSMVKELYGKARNAFRGQGSVSDKERNMLSNKKESMPSPLKGQGAITETERSVTVSPAGKKRGGVAC